MEGAVGGWDAWQNNSDSGAESGSGGPPSLDSDGDLRVATETNQPEGDSDTSMDTELDLLRVLDTDDTSDHNASVMANAVSDLEERMGQQEADVTFMREQASMRDKQIAAQQAQITSQVEKIAAHDIEVAIQEQNIKQLLDQTSKQDGMIAEQQHQISHLVEERTKQGEQMTTLQHQMAHMMTLIDKRHQDDITNLKLHYDTQLTEQQEQITGQREQMTHQQEQIAQLWDVMWATVAVRNMAMMMWATVAVRNMAMSNLNDRVEMLGPTCTNLREDVDRIDETVERIDEQFYPESNAVCRGAPHDGGDEVIDEYLTVHQLATNA